MAKPPPVDDLAATELFLYGRRQAERYNDDELAVIGDMPNLERSSLHEQYIERLPPFRPTLKSLRLDDCFSLESLAGIERLVGLQSLTLSKLRKIDLDRACKLLAELPELTELHLDSFDEVPASIKKLPSLLALHLAVTPKLDLAAALAAIGKIPTLRTLTLRGPLVLPDALAPLAKLTTFGVHKASGAVPASIGTLVKLEKLSLAYCAFTALPAEIGKLRQLAALHVEKVPLTALPDELCACTSLTSLELDDVDVRALPAALGKLAKLEKLTISGKKLKSLPESIGELAKLRHLRIPWNDRLVVPDSLYGLELETFSGPSAVQEKLTLRAPPSTPESDRVWLHDADRLPADFGDPKELDLSLHEHTAPLPQLSALQRLEELGIDTGNLADAFRRLVGARRLRTLVIHGEHPTLPDELGELVQLEELRIANDRHSAYEACVLERLPDTIGKLVHLRSFTLARNRLVALTDAIGDLAALETLDLEPGTLTELPPALGRLTKLQTLRLGRGVLHKLPADLARCPALATFSMIGGWSEVPPIVNFELLGELPALTTLQLSRVRELPVARLLDALAGRPLEKLDLSDNPITELPASIGRLAKLRSLELDGTHLETLPPALRECTELRYISLPVYKLDRDVVAKIKDYLPKGRWKKNFRSHVTWWTRSD